MEKQDSQKFVKEVVDGNHAKAEALLEKLLKEKVAKRLKSVLNV